MGLLYYKLNLRLYLSLYVNVTSGVHLKLKLVLMECKMLVAGPASSSDFMRAGCKMEDCQRSHGSFTALVDHDWEFCQGINEYLSCLHKTRRGCKGNINFHVIHKGLSTLYDKRGCLSALQGPPPATSPRPLEFPGRPHGEHEASTETAAPLQPLDCAYQATDMRHCGLFGDPHLKTFEGHFQTCRVQGAWPLIDSRYLAVQVTNEPVRPGSYATVTTKVS